MKTKIKLKIAIITLFVMICVTTTQAQLKVGMKAGINVSTQSDLGDLYNNQDLKTGLSIGGTVLYQFSENIATQLELNYIQKGTKARSGDENTNINANCDYFLFPLTLRGTTLINEKMTRGYLETGAYFGYMINNKKSTSNASLDEKRFYDNDLGLVFGIGLIKPIQEINVLIGLRYEMGLMKVSRLDNDLRNKTFTLSVGYQF